MNGRLRSSVAAADQQQLASDISGRDPSRSNHPPPLPLPDRLAQPSASRQSPADWGYSSPSDYPTPSPGPNDLDYEDHPESSAQAAARFAASNQARAQDSSLDPPPAQLTHDTFGRTSGHSAISDNHTSSSARRKTSPTERSAFGYLASSWIQPSSSLHSDEITEYLSQASAPPPPPPPRQRLIDALEKQLNLTPSPTPTTGSSSIDEQDMWRPPGHSHPQHPSDTADRTFGTPSRQQSHTTTASADSRPPNDTTHSETTSSRGTDPSRDVAYGVGEAGGDQQFNVLTRTLTPSQQRQQQELDRMNQQRNLVTSPPATSSAIDSRTASPLTGKAALRASHQSNTTVTGFTNTTGSLASSSTPRHDLRLSRQTQDTLSPSALRPLSLPEQDDSPPRQASHPPLFAGKGSHDSIDALNGPASPKPADIDAPTRSASVRAKTPVFGNTLSELPPGQRKSLVGALHHQAAEPHASPSQHDVQNLQQQNQPPYAAPNDQQWQSEQQQRGYYMYQDPADQKAHHAEYRHAFADHNGHRPRDDAVRTPHVPHLGDAYSLAPKLPPPPYSMYRAQLHLPSRWARVHHTVLPLLTYAYIPATLFLDYNVIFAVVQIALHPDTFQSGTRTAWWIATGIYAGCVLAWLVGVVLIYETLWSFRRRWTVQQPLAMPIYLSSPAFVRTAIKDYSLYSLLYRARSTSGRRDALIESFWYYSQNWPTVLTLLPRGVIAAIVLVLYKPAGPARPTQSQRDTAYFDQSTQRLTQFAFIIITIQAAWVAWKLAVLLIANIGLAVTIGPKSLVLQEKVRNEMADTEMTSFAAHSRRGLVARHFGSQPAPTQGWSDAEDRLEQAAQRPWAWRWRAEDRIRAILFDAGLLHQPMQNWHGDRPHEVARLNEGAAEHNRGAVPYDQSHGAGAYDPQSGDRDWFGPGLTFSESQTGLALTSPEAVQPETWTAAQAGGAPLSVVTAAPQEQQPFHVQHHESSPSDEGRRSDVSDPYSPAPLPIGRSPRSKEQLRDASSISSLNRLAALNSAHSGSHDSPHAAADSSPHVSSLQSHDDAYTSIRTAADVFTRPGHAQAEPASRLAPLGMQDAEESSVPAAAPTVPMQTSDDSGMLGEWRGRKRPRSSPVPANYATLNPHGMVTETEDWLRGQIDEEDEDDGLAESELRDPAKHGGPKLGDNDRRVMQAFVPPLGSFAMSKDPSLAGSPDQGGSDTKHGSWTAVAPNPELFAQRPEDAASKTTLPLRTQADAKNGSTTSLGSSLKGGRSGTYSRPRSSGHGHEVSSEDGVSFDGAEAKKRGRNSLLGRMTNASPSETSKRSGSAGRAEGESWIASLFGMRGGSRKVSAAGSTSSLKGSAAGDTSLPNSDGHAEGVPTLITTSASTTLPTTDSGDVQAATLAKDDDARGSLLMAPLGQTASDAGRSASPSGSNHSKASAGSDDSEERRLWASFPDQSRSHPPGLIALDLEQRASTSAPVNLSPLMHPNVLAAIGGASPLGLPAVLGGVAQLSVSPSEGGLHAIREESWTSSLDSRSQGATGSTRSRGTASAFTTSPVDADFPLEQIQEVPVPHTGSSSHARRGST